MRTIMNKLRVIFKSYVFMQMVLVQVSHNTFLSKNNIEIDWFN